MTAAPNSSPSAKVLVIADTHCKNVAQTQELVELVRPFTSNVSLILHAGDLVTADVLDALDQLAPTYAVRGNMDVLDMSDRWPEKRIVQVDGFRVGMAHGSGPPFGLIERVRALFDAGEVDVIVFGHTHEPFVDDVDGVLMVNPGSPTDRRFTDHNSIALLAVGEDISATIIDLPR